MEPAADRECGAGAEGSAAVAPLRIEELKGDAVFRHEVIRWEVRETHISWVVLTGTFAYKIKKPLKFDFCDATTLERRRFLCEEEVRLNRRLAASIYLDVVAITRDSKGVHLGGSGTIVEFAVRMRQFDTSQELATLLARREVSVEELIRLADRLARFHADAPRAPGSDAYDYALRFERTMLANIARLVAHRPSVSSLPDWSQVVAGVHELLQRRGSDLRERHAAGFVRECHGDLHAHNIVRWHGELTPFDCLEFDPQLRRIDVMNDIAFLAMDLLTHGRRDLACSLVSRYAECTGDYRGIRLLPLYLLDRALVRAMVDALAAEQQPDRGEGYGERLRARVGTAAAILNPAPPTLYLMHGPSGSGKSWLSGRLVPLLGAVRIRSDLERKRLAGLEPHARAPQSLYSPEWNTRVYEHLAACAEDCLGAGLSTIVDAAFLDEARRRCFRELAMRRQLRFKIVSCRASRDRMAARIAARASSGADPSDAGLDVLEEQLMRVAPFTGEEARDVISLDTTQANVERAACAALAE